jgi:hypothetical protein
MVHEMQKWQFDVIDNIQMRTNEEHEENPYFNKLG